MTTPRIVYKCTHSPKFLTGSVDGEDVWMMYVYEKEEDIKAAKITLLAYYQSDYFEPPKMEEKDGKLLIYENDNVQDFVTQWHKKFP